MNAPFLILPPMSLRPNQQSRANLAFYTILNCLTPALSMDWQLGAQTLGIVKEWFGPPSPSLTLTMDWQDVGQMNVAIASASPSGDHLVEQKQL